MESRTLAHNTLHRDTSSHSVHDLLHEGKTHASTDVLRFVFCLIEGLKHMCKCFFVHTFARVADVNVQKVFLLPCRHTDCPIFWRELESI